MFAKSGLTPKNLKIYSKPHQFWCMCARRMLQPSSSVLPKPCQTVRFKVFKQLPAGLGEFSVAKLALHVVRNSGCYQGAAVNQRAYHPTVLHPSRTEKANVSCEQLELILLKTKHVWHKVDGHVRNGRMLPLHVDVSSPSCGFTSRLSSSR